MGGMAAIALAAGFGFGHAKAADASILLNDAFDTASETANTVPAGWTDIINYTSSNTASTANINGAFVAPSSAGYPFVDHTTGVGNFAFFGNDGPLSPSVSAINNWFISPALAVNGSAAQVTFWTFASKSTASMDVLLSTDGSNNVPNYGADFTSGAGVTNSSQGTYDNGKTTYTGVAVGDFTTTLLSLNDAHASGGYPAFTGGSTPWTEYTINIPAGEISGTGYIAFRENVAAGTNTNFNLGLDDVTVSSVPEPASAGLLAVGSLALLRRRRAGIAK
jgi:hypothetical protein